MYAVNPDGVGEALLPGLIIDDPEHRNMIIGVVPSALNYDMDPVAIEASSPRRDYAIARVYLEDGILKAELTFKKAEARSAGLEIVKFAVIGKTLKYPVAKEVIASINKTGPMKRSRMLAHGTDIIIISSKETLSPRTIHKALNKALKDRYLPRIAGFMNGEYYAILALNCKLRRDISIQRKLDIRIADSCREQ